MKLFGGMVKQFAEIRGSRIPRSKGVKLAGGCAEFLGKRDFGEDRRV